MSAAVDEAVNGSPFFLGFVSCSSITFVLFLFPHLYFFVPVLLLILLSRVVDVLTYPYTCSVCSFLLYIVPFVFSAIIGGSCLSVSRL